MLPQELKMKQKPCGFYAFFKYKNQSIKLQWWAPDNINNLYTGKQFRDELFTFDNRDWTHSMQIDNIFST